MILRYGLRGYSDKLVRQQIFYAHKQFLLTHKHILLTSDQDHQKFEKFPTSEKFEKHSCRSHSSPSKKNEGFCGRCKTSRCEIWEHIVSTDQHNTTQPT